MPSELDRSRYRCEEALKTAFGDALIATDMWDAGYGWIIFLLSTNIGLEVLRPRVT